MGLRICGLSMWAILSLQLIIRSCFWRWLGILIAFSPMTLNNIWRIGIPLFLAMKMEKPLLMLWKNIIGWRRLENRNLWGGARRNPSPIYRILNLLHSPAVMRLINVYMLIVKSLAR